MPGIILDPGETETSLIIKLINHREQNKDIGLACVYYLCYLHLERKNLESCPSYYWICGLIDASVMDKIESLLLEWTNGCTKLSMRLLYQSCFYCMLVLF